MVHKLLNDLADAIASGNTSQLGSATLPVTPPDQPLANTAGNPVGIVAQKGQGSGAGGAVSIRAGQAGATGTGGAFTILSGAGGSTSGGSGAMAVDAGAVTSGTAGTVTIGGTNAAATVIGRTAGTTTINGTVTQPGTTTISGTTTLSGATTISGALSITSATFAPGTPGASSQSIADNGTITLPTTGICVSVATSTAANKTGAIVTAGTVDGQELLVVNTSSNTITMATAATSNVSNGVTCVLGVLMAQRFVWSTTAARWFPLKS